jgi:flavin-binding protein dodecin
MDQLISDGISNAIKEIVDRALTKLKNIEWFS